VDGRLPSLGPRGEGWFIGQLVFLVAIGMAPLDTWPEPLLTVGRGAGVVLVLAGLVVAGRAIIDLGPNLTPFPRPRRTGELVERGVYVVLRHPIYGGLVLITVGWSLVRSSGVGLLLSLAFALFLDLKARREEQLLAAAFPRYEAYRRRTSRFIPRIY
jgi:protein-S-isoprenylcysteine O-methyltransferase Ste14